MKRIMKNTSLNSNEMSNIHGGNMVHTSFAFFGGAILDVYDDSNNNGSLDSGEQFSFVNSDGITISGTKQ